MNNSRFLSDFGISGMSLGSSVATRNSLAAVLEPFGGMLEAILSNLGLSEAIMEAISGYI